MDWKLELVAVPVSDVDRAKFFYTDKVGFEADHDHTVSDEIRFVQLTPPGSACSIAIGKGVVDSQPGSARGLQLVVSDIQAAHSELVERGVEVSEVRKLPGGLFVFFSDPDGNGWVVQQTSGPSQNEYKARYCRFAGDETAPRGEYENDRPRTRSTIPRRGLRPGSSRSSAPSVAPSGPAAACQIRSCSATG